MIYEPAEDSYFLSEILKKIKFRKEDKILDMGAGSGIQAQTLISLGVNPKSITLVDINKEAIFLLKKRFPNSKIIHSDLFEGIKDRFDLIIFNPPYLPENLEEPNDSKIATTGGKKGSETINKFLQRAKDYLTENGKIILLASSLTKGIKFSGYKKKILAKKKLFFEELRIWELVKI